MIGKSQTDVYKSYWEKSLCFVPQGRDFQVLILPDNLEHYSGFNDIFYFWVSLGI